ncbi:hypothetical protein [Parendozoicomonas haliclonae]|uniref:hypothetical protein n=1 Tax=Parendozoicomonas haliclonae TaxID=1960125 RepID=UPI000B35C778|nr:hypothetical protein [Parendozoicomonas haliclonae]
MTIKSLLRSAAVLLFFTFSCLCFATGSPKPDAEEEITWESYHEWLTTDAQSRAFTKAFTTHHFNLEDVVMAWKNPPDFLEAYSLDGLLNDLLFYIDEWLQSHDIAPPPAIVTITPELLPEKPLEDFLQYVTDRDAILLPAIAHLHHLAFAEDSPLSEEELEYFRYRLRWINDVRLPEGVTIDWEQEFQELVGDFSNPELWQNRLQIPTSRTTIALKKQAAADPYKDRVEPNLGLEGYNLSLNMKTTWNAYMALHDNKMKFSEMTDPLLNAHNRFSLAASVFGPYYSREEDYRLIAYWLRHSELEHKLTPTGRKLWREQVAYFTVPTANKREDLALKDESSAPQTHKKSKGRKRTVITKKAESKTPDSKPKASPKQRTQNQSEPVSSNSPKEARSPIKVPNSASASTFDVGNVMQAMTTNYEALKEANKPLPRLITSISSTNGNRMNVPPSPMLTPSTPMTPSIPGPPTNTPTTPHIPYHGNGTGFHPLDMMPQPVSQSSPLARAVPSQLDFGGGHHHPPNQRGFGFFGPVNSTQSYSPPPATPTVTSGWNFDSSFKF